jgi:hypothetical protein
MSGKALLLKSTYILKKRVIPAKLSCLPRKSDLQHVRGGGGGFDQKRKENNK